MSRDVSFSGLDRAQGLKNAQSTEFDLLIIGGGITGAGILLDAVLRGLKVLLIEKEDFGWGTSSRSTKLIHGGLRYLKQMELKLVRDVGRERAIVYKNAPHLVLPEKMLLPIVKGGSLGSATTSAALYVYDLLAGVEKPERRKMLPADQTLSLEPLLNNEFLLGGGLYYEYRTDDARLVISLIKSAIERGGNAYNYCSADGFEKDEQGIIKAVNCSDRITGGSYRFTFKSLVNAAGPWVDDVRSADAAPKGKRLKLTKGVHLVFPYAKVPLKQATYFDVGDGRMIFAIPRGKVTYVGTTDTFYDGDTNRPVADNNDAVYLVNAVNRMFSGLNLKPGDAESSWCGLRPLIYEEGKSASELSRKDEIFFSPSGLISIAGGKLTGFRLMAEKVVDVVIHKLNLKSSVKACSTRTYPLAGARWEIGMKEDCAGIIKRMIQLGGSEEAALEWFYRYGNDSNKILDLMENISDADVRRRTLKAELEYSVLYEGCCRPADYMVRRSGRLYFDLPELEKDFDLVLEYFAMRLGYDAATGEQERQACKTLIADALAFRKNQS